MQVVIKSYRFFLTNQQDVGGALMREKCINTYIPR